MKQIVMLQGMGNNERGWARMVSQFGRVVLIQQGLIQHVEIWENQGRVYNGPETSLQRTRMLDELSLCALTMRRSVARCLEFNRGHKIDLVIAANYSMGSAALLLRLAGKARKTVVFLSDYLPPKGPLAVRMHRRVTTALTRFVARHADEVWSISPRIPTASVNARNFVVPICMDDNHAPVGERKEIGYIGYPSQDHALDVLFDIGRRHQFRLNIIGDSPYLRSIKHLAPPDTVFHGILNEPEKIGAIFARCFCGYAVYRNTGPDNYSYYGFPSKTLYCFASNTPVVTTDTAHFTQNVEKFGLGRVVEPTPDKIEQAVLQLREQFPKFYEAINHFRNVWNRQSLEFHRERLTDLLKP